jgi:hypothetical protein
MNCRLIIRDEAEADIAEAALWYHLRTPGLGDEFLAEVRAAIQRAVKTLSLTGGCAVVPKCAAY